MRIILQRVKRASVTANGETIGAIDHGVLLLFAVHKNDTQDKVPSLADKVANLRIFENTEGKMDHSLQDVQGGALVVSQFTLYADCSHGRRPDFFEAAPPAQAEPIYHAFISALKQKIERVETGRFGALMEVELLNHGPVTLILETMHSS